MGGKAEAVVEGWLLIQSPSKCVGCLKATGSSDWAVQVKGAEGTVLPGERCGVPQGQTSPLVLCGV